MMLTVRSTPSRAKAENSKATVVPIKLGYGPPPHCQAPSNSGTGRCWKRCAGPSRFALKIDIRHRKAHSLL